jgi:DNA-binding ferritin-like protein
MPLNHVVTHLRGLAKTARIMEQEASTPEARRVLEKLGTDYEAWAERIEQMEGATSENHQGRSVESRR